MDMKIKMPPGAAFIIDELNNHGFEAYIVGGCVRDSLLGKNPNDWDITTSATPYQVKDIFKKTVDTGLQHGTVTVLVDRQHSCGGEYAYEVTTYRVDGIYEDHRRPKEVTFSNSIEEDLKRRDFTINAMAYNDDEGVVDIFGGATDLKNGVIRCVGVPQDRFDEDALRILRAVRFAAQLGFNIDEPTKESMKNQARFLKDISAERIREEFTKLIISDNPGMLVMAPKNRYEFEAMLDFAYEYDGPVAIKYARGTAYKGFEEFKTPIEAGKSEIIYDGEDIAVLSCGNMLEEASKLCDMLKADGKSPTLVNVRFVSCVDMDMLKAVCEKHSTIITMEENISKGGYGELVAAAIVDSGLDKDRNIVHIDASIKQAVVPHGKISELRDMLGISAGKIYERL